MKTAVRAESFKYLSTFIVIYLLQWCLQTIVTLVSLSVLHFNTFSNNRINYLWSCHFGGVAVIEYIRAIGRRSVVCVCIWWFEGGKRCGKYMKLIPGVWNELIGWFKGGLWSSSHCQHWSQKIPLTLPCTPYSPKQPPLCHLTFTLWLLHIQEQPCHLISMFNSDFFKLIRTSVRSNIS